MTPILGAYIADAHLGRYKTICIAVVITLIGHILLVISALPSVIQHGGAIGAFSVALIVMGLGESYYKLGTSDDTKPSCFAGTGMFKSNISPLVAEQYKGTKLFLKTTKTGERVIVDPALTVARIYMVCFHSLSL